MSGRRRPPAGIARRCRLSYSCPSSERRNGGTCWNRADYHEPLPSIAIPKLLHTYIFFKHIYKFLKFYFTLTSVESKMSSCRQASMLNIIISPSKSKLLRATRLRGPDPGNPLLFRSIGPGPLTATEGSAVDSLSMSKTSTTYDKTPRLTTKS